MGADQYLCPDEHQHSADDESASGQTSEGPVKKEVAGLQLTVYYAGQPVIDNEQRNPVGPTVEQERFHARHALTE
jgi:hypothetical protein